MVTDMCDVMWWFTCIFPVGRFDPHHRGECCTGSCGICHLGRFKFDLIQGRWSLPYINKVKLFIVCIHHICWCIWRFIYEHLTKSLEVTVHAYALLTFVINIFKVQRCYTYSWTPNTSLGIQFILVQFYLYCSSQLTITVSSSCFTVGGNNYFNLCWNWKFLSSSMRNQNLWGCHSIPTYTFSF